MTSDISLSLWVKKQGIEIGTTKVRKLTKYVKLQCQIVLKRTQHRPWTTPHISHRPMTFFTTKGPFIYAFSPRDKLRNLRSFEATLFVGIAPRKCASKYI